MRRARQLSALLGLLILGRSPVICAQAVVTGVPVNNAIAAPVKNAGLRVPIDAQGTGLMLRFQLIKATTTRTVDPAIAGIDSALKDLFRFPGYKLLSSAAVAIDYGPPQRGAFGSTSAEQLLRGDGITYRLGVRVDTAFSQMVRINVWLYEPITPVATKTASGGTVSSDRYILLNTTVTVAYGRTVVLGSTQPARAGQPGVPLGTLILAVKPEFRTP